MGLEPAGRPPTTYRTSPHDAADNLDYTDMIALAQTFVQWAMEESDINPSHRTMLIELGVDYENLAKWVGPEWKAANPSETPNLLRLIAELVRSADL